MAKCHIVVVVLFLTTFANGQFISTSTPVPPLQWINLTGLLTGSGPPPLKGVSLGYDNLSRNLLIFGGESEGGFVQSDTYLWVLTLGYWDWEAYSHIVTSLNLDSLEWAKPSSPPNLQGSPPARSAAMSGDDFAANRWLLHSFRLYWQSKCLLVDAPMFLLEVWMDDLHYQMSG